MSGGAAGKTEIFGPHGRISRLEYWLQVLLDVESIQPDRILLLDSFFYVVVFHGTSIAQWRKEGYHLQEEHAGFKQLLEVTHVHHP